MDNNKDAVYIQQLRKYCKDNKKWNEIFPVTFIQAIYNAANGNRLDTLLAMYNSIFVEYKGSFATTVAAIDNIVRKKGLIITYFDENNLSWTRRYKLHDVSDINFQNEDNWEGYNFDILVDEIYKAIKYIFTNIDEFPDLKDVLIQQIIEVTDLKNVLIQQITEITENTFNNIEDYTNLYNIFKELIKENINNVFNNINNYTNLKNLINTNIYNRVDYIFNNIDDFKVLLNKINVAILNRVDYIFNNINKYPELKQLIINSLQAKQLFTIEFSVNGDTLDIINKDELNSYIENNNVNNNALVTFIGKFFDSSNNKLLYNLVFTAFVNTSSAYLNLNNCYGETLIINDGKLYKCKINFNIDTETPINAPNWITNIRKYDDIPNKLITDVSVIAQGTNDDVIIRTTYSERINNDSSYVANKYRDYQLPEAQQGRAGLMSTSDKVKLDNIIIIKLTGTDLTSVNEDTDINSVKNTNINITEFSTILDSLNSDKNVKIYINEYNDAVKQTFNINCDIAFNYNSKEIFIQYDIYDVNKRIYASLYKDGDRVSLKILAVKNKYTKFYYIDSDTLYNPTKGKSINLSAAQFSMQQFDELVSDIQKRKDFCVYSTVFTSKNSDVKYYRYNINCIINSDTQLLCNYINPLDNSYIKFTMNKLTANVQIIINEKYNIINTIDVLNTVMSGLVLTPDSGNQFETNQRYSSSDTLIQLINKFIQNSGYNDFRIVHSPTIINFVFGTTINNSNPIVNVLSFASNLLVRAPVLRIYSKSIDFSEVATLTYTELDNTIRDGSWRSFELDLSNIGSGGSDYTLPIASATTLGGIKIPANGQMTIDKNGNLYPNAATSNSAGIVKPGVGSGLLMNGSSISVTLGRRDINLGTLTPGSTINGGYYYIYDDTVLGNASPGFNLNNKINSWDDPLAIIIVNRKNTGGIYFKGTNINMLTATNDCTKIGAIFIRYFQNGNENGYFVWAVPKVIQ